MDHWVERRHDVLEAKNHGTWLVKVSRRLQSNQVLLEPFKSRQTGGPDLQYFLERRGHGNLSFTDKFFLKLLSLTQPNKTNRNIFSGDKSRQPDQISSEVKNLDLFTHVQNIDSTLLADGGGLEHQLNRLRNQHKISLNLGVGHGNRPSRLDLLLET